MYYKVSMTTLNAISLLHLLQKMSVERSPKFPRRKYKSLLATCTNAVNKNTVKTTKTRINLWKSRAESKNLTRTLSNVKSNNCTLFFAKICNSNGSD